MLTLGAVYDAGRPMREFGVTAERVAALRAAIAESERGVTRKKEREVLALYKRALEVYASLALRTAAAGGPTFEDGLKLHLEADRRYLGSSTVEAASGSVLAPGGSACRVRQ